jgi:predicted nucleotide-binding protein
MARSPRQEALYGKLAAPAPAPGPPGLTRPRAEVTAQLQERSDRGKELQARAIQSHSDMEAYKNDAQKWREYNSELLAQLFTSEAIQKEYMSSARPSRMARDEVEVFKIRRETVNREIAKLESIVERLGLYQEVVPESALCVEDRALKDRSKVFVVHGHDEAARLAVAGFLQKIGLEAITLQDQPDQGLTIIEKFEAYAREVGFAVVLLTPDDVVGAVSASSPMSRARQNVIFELGYFVGKLGRGKGWKLKLAKELRAAEFEFDDAKVWA